MAYTIHITQNADEAGAYITDMTLAELTAAIGSSGFDINELLAALPTEDPLADGQFWLNSGVVTISSGDA